MMTVTLPIGNSNVIARLGPAQTELNAGTTSVPSRLAMAAVAILAAAAPARRALRVDPVHTLRQE
jgi:hypothetical protein